MTFKIKMEAEDFQVVEIPQQVSMQENGKYTVLKLRLKNWETNHFVIEFSRYLGISRKRITYAGTKDKRAVTTQYFCINAEKIPEQIKIKDVEELDRFKTDKIIDLGDLLGNKFEIRVESQESELIKVRDFVTSKSQNLFFWNYFGIQRFGQLRKNTHLIGEQLVKNGLESAIKTYLFTPGTDNEEYRINLSQSWDYKKGIKEFPEHLQFERALMSELISGKSYEDAFDSLPRSLRIMFVHAFQSYIFNEILEERKKYVSTPIEIIEGDLVSPIDEYYNITEGKKIEATAFNLQRLNKLSVEGMVVPLAPLIGTMTDGQEGIPGEIMGKIMDKFKIERKDFKIQSKPELTSTGNYRGISIKPIDFKLISMDKYSFSLGKGMYATVLLDQLFGLD